MKNILLLSYFDDSNNNFNSLQSFKKLEKIDSGSGNREFLVRKFLTFSRCFIGFIKEKAFIEKYPTTFFINEAQKIINKNNIPEVSVCREFQCEYILATQNDFIMKFKHNNEIVNNELFSKKPWIF